MDADQIAKLRTGLSPQADAVLRSLAEARGKVVSKQALMDAAWPDTAVTENSLYQCIAEIRRALGENAVSLKTVPRHGYRLVVARHADRRRLPFMLAAICAAIAVLGWFAWPRPMAQQPQTPTVSVATFENLGDNPRWDRLGRAMAGDIAVALAANDWLIVVSETDAGSIAPGYRLTGTIQEEAGEVLVQARLAARHNDAIVWSNRWRGAAGELFDMQDAISEQVSGALAPEWSGVIARTDRRAAHKRTTDNLDAYENFLIGAEHKHRFTPRDYEQAVIYLKRAITLDPDYHTAWATLAVVYALQGSNAATPEDLAPIFAARIEAIETAARLVPDDPQVLVQMNWLNGHRRDFEAAEQVIRRAVERAPANADILAEAAWIGNWRNSLGEVSVDWADRAQQLNPDWPDWYAVGAGLSRFNLGRYDEAVIELAKAPNFIERHLYTAAAEAHLGNLDAAFAAKSRLMELKPDFNLRTYTIARAIHLPEVRDRLWVGAAAAGMPLDPPAGQ